MLVKLLDNAVTSLLNKFLPTLYLAPLAIVPNWHASGLTISDILEDGILWATPKRRTPARKKWTKMYGNENWPIGQKLWKPKRNIVTCIECGSFHEIHTICRNCWEKVEEETKKILDSVRNTWGRGVIDKEVELLYEGEQAPQTSQKRIVELERPRPLWFAPNLSHKTANPTRKIDGPAVEIDDRTVREKIDDTKGT